MIVKTKLSNHRKNKNNKNCPSMSSTSSSWTGRKLGAMIAILITYVDIKLYSTRWCPQIPQTKEEEYEFVIKYKMEQ